MTYITGHYIEEVEERIDDHFQGNLPSALLKGEQLEAFILDLYAHDKTVIEAAETIIKLAAQGGDTASLPSLGEDEKREDARMDERLRDELDVIRKETDCPSRETCAELGFEDICTVQPDGATDFLGCDEGATCEMALAQGARHYCRCPLQICIKEELCLYTASEVATVV